MSARVGGALKGMSAGETQHAEPLEASSAGLAERRAPDTVAVEASTGVTERYRTSAVAAECLKSPIAGLAVRRNDRVPEQPETERLSSQATCSALECQSRQAEHQSWRVPGDCGTGEAQQ